MAGKYGNKKKKGAASYAGKWRKTSGTSGRSKVLKSGERQSREILTCYKDNVTLRCVNEDLATNKDTEKFSSCIENIPVKITDIFSDNFKKNVKDKYEEFRIAKFECRVMFSNTSKPVHYQIDKESTSVVHPKFIAEDPSAMMKLVNDSNRNLVITWTPRRGSSDMDFHKVNALDNAEMSNLEALGFIKILQHNLPVAVGSEGCNMQIRATLVCRGLTDVTGTALTAAQIAYANDTVHPPAGN